MIARARSEISRGGYSRVSVLSTSPLSRHLFSVDKLRTSRGGRGPVNNSTGVRPPAAAGRRVFCFVLRLHMQLADECPIPDVPPCRGHDKKGARREGQRHVPARSPPPIKKARALSES